MSSEAPYLTMHEIERLYDGQWVLIEEPLTDDNDVVAGRLTAHSPRRDEVYASAAARGVRDAAVLFIGCPTYEGELMLPLTYGR